MSHTKTAGVYCIRNKVNGKVYIGSSHNLKQRFLEHKSQIRLNKHDNRHIQEDLLKYGKDVFVFEILEEFVNKETKYIREREQFYIDNTHCELYNICPKADGSVTAEETKHLISEKHAGKKMSEDVKQKMIHTLKTYYSQPEIKAKLRERLQGEKNPFWGKHISEEHKKRMAIGRQLHNTGVNHPLFGTHRSEETRQKISDANGKSCICVETGKIYKSLKSAAEDYGVTNSAIMRACQGKVDTSAKRHWKYL